MGEAVYRLGFKTQFLQLRPSGSYFYGRPSVQVCVLMCVYVSALVCVYVRVCVCACVCVRARVSGVAPPTDPPT